MNDRMEKSFTQWLIDIEIEKTKILGELLDLIRLETPRQIFETDDLDRVDDGPDVELELDKDGFFVPF